MTSTFWQGIEAQLKEVAEHGKTADDVVRILNKYGPPSSGDAFFGGGGGDDTLQEALEKAGWRLTWADAWYYYVAKAPDGSLLTYIEGDVCLGDVAIKE